MCRVRPNPACQGQHSFSLCSFKHWLKCLTHNLWAESFRFGLTTWASGCTERKLCRAWTPNCTTQVKWRDGNPRPTVHKTQRTTQHKKSTLPLWWLMTEPNKMQKINMMQGEGGTSSGLLMIPSIVRVRLCVGCCGGLCHVSWQRSADKLDARCAELNTICLFSSVLRNLWSFPREVVWSRLWEYERLSNN